MLKVKNEKGQWVEFPGYKPHSETLKLKLLKGGKIHVETVKAVTEVKIVEVPPMTKEEVEDFIDKWKKLSKETIIELIDDTE